MASKLCSRLLTATRLQIQSAQLSSKATPTAPLPQPSLGIAALDDVAFFNAETTIPSAALRNTYTTELVQRYSWMRAVAPKDYQKGPVHKVSSAPSPTTQFNGESAFGDNINPCFRADLLDMPARHITPHQTTFRASASSSRASNAFKKTNTTFDVSSSQRSNQLAALEEYNEVLVIGGQKVPPSKPLEFFDEGLALRMGL